jgi:hypothetical protein
MNPPLITCTCCNGTGKRELSEAHWRTLQKVLDADGPISSFCLIGQGVKATAVNNRLAYLENTGFIRRVGKDGKFILWEAVYRK